MTNIGTIHITIDFTGHERSMAIRAYIWDAAERNILASIEGFEAADIVMSALAHFRVRDLMTFIQTLHPGAAVELHIANEARNYFDQQGTLQKIEGAFTIAAIAA